MQPAHKFGWFPEQKRKYECPDILAFERTFGPERLVIGPSADHRLIFFQLMPEPLGILYLLVVPRGGSEGGRYQTASPVSKQQAEGFLSNFREYLENDGRHDIWVASRSGPDQLVYDRHYVIYAYGRLREYENALLGGGLRKVEFVRFPSPHTHNYHAAFDQDELDLLRHWRWKRSPLRENDE